MTALDDLLQKIRNMPEKLRTPYISNKELDQISREICLVKEFENNKRMEIK
jgi:hypothetical protein